MSRPPRFNPTTPEEWERIFASSGAGTGAANLRVVSKGSSRGAGPQVKRGRVYRHAFEGHPARVTCPCGKVKLRCDECGVFWCNAPGHAAHECGRAP